jgi:hypothetical protein
MLIATTTTATSIRQRVAVISLSDSTNDRGRTNIERKSFIGETKHRQTKQGSEDDFNKRGIGQKSYEHNNALTTEGAFCPDKRYFE